MHRSYDVIVIGAGSAGCVLAARLSEDPTREVALLEAGPDYETRGALPPDIADGRRLPSDRSDAHDWGLESVPVRSGASPFPLPRGRIVGGSSAVNGTFALRGFAEDYDAWQASGNDGWGSDSVFDVFRRLENDLDFGERAWHGTEGSVPIRRYRPEEMSVSARTFLEAAERAGHLTVEDHNQPGAVGTGPLPVNSLDGMRMSAALTHLEPARKRSNLTVRGDAPVDRIEIEGGRARGVRLTSGEIIRADLVVLSAGAYASPCILLRSGIGAADELVELGIEPVVNLPGVGRNLIDHALVAVNAPVPADSFQYPAYQTMLSWRSDNTSGPPDLHLFACGPFESERVAHDEGAMRMCVALLKPASSGHVRLTSSDPSASPRIDAGYLRDSSDLDRLAAGVGEARRILSTMPLSSLTGGREISPGDDIRDDADLRAKLPDIVRTYYHPVGTCRMGRDPGDGTVVDARGRLHDVDDLMVVDASIMPDIPRANTNLPTMMVAEHISTQFTGRQPADPLMKTMQGVSYES